MGQDVRETRLSAPPPKPASESIYALLLISRVSLLLLFCLGRLGAGAGAGLPNSTHTDSISQLSSFRQPNSFYHHSSSLQSETQPSYSPLPPQALDQCRQRPASLYERVRCTLIADERAAVCAGFDSILFSTSTLIGKS
ncbi:hypothetical protein CBL_09115 [Carabus blaptoides fortunei]